ncbi:MAG TPA: ribbon-helix-helix domain-containing protein [Candidatus Competibacter sp.]|nr:ribbon-helix-helix domain-containing protein [Candidatus Competibacter sp.]
MTRMVGFSIPPTMADEFERMAEEEQRTKSELFREMFRVYRNYRLQKQKEGTSFDHPINQVVEETQVSYPVT